MVIEFYKDETYNKIIVSKCDYVFKRKFFRVLDRYKKLEGINFLHISNCKIDIDKTISSTIIKNYEHFFSQLNKIEIYAINDIKSNIFEILQYSPKLKIVQICSLEGKKHIIDFSNIYKIESLEKISIYPALIIKNIKKIKCLNKLNELAINGICKDVTALLKSNAFYNDKYFKHKNKMIKRNRFLDTVFKIKNDL